MSKKKETRGLWIQEDIQNADYDKMPAYAKNIWSNVPHFIISSIPDENGDYTIIYPSLFDSYTYGGDLECFESEHSHVGFMGAVVYNHGEDDPLIRQTMVLMKTVSPEEAKNAILKLHKLMYTFNNWYIYPIWLKTLEMFHEQFGHADRFFEAMHQYWNENSCYILLDDVMKAKMKEATSNE